MSTTAPGPLTLESLQEQINDLQAQLALAQADSLAPNYITITPEGQVGAEFTGTINAYGITLPLVEGTGAAATEQVIQWLGTENSNNPAGNPPGVMFATYDAGSDLASMDVISGADDPAGTSRVLLIATDDTPTAQAYLYAEQQARGATSSVQAVAGGHAVEIIGQDGSSSFVQGTGIRLASGRGQVAAPGTYSTFGISIPHGLPSAPIAAWVAVAGSPSIWVPGTHDATYIQGNLITTGETGGDVNLYVFPAGQPIYFQWIACT